MMMKTASDDARLWHQDLLTRHCLCAPCHYYGDASFGLLRALSPCVPCVSSCGSCSADRCSLGFVLLVNHWPGGQSDFLGQIDMQLDVLEDESEHDGWYFLTPKPSIFTSQINQQVGSPLHLNHAQYQVLMYGIQYRPGGSPLTERFSCLVAAGPRRPRILVLMSLWY